MQVFKFGGASVRSAEAIRGVARILEAHHEDRTVVVVSAMGKTTNALEEVVSAYAAGRDDWREKLDGIRAFHRMVAAELFGGETHRAVFAVDALFDQITRFVEFNNATNFRYIYDQIVCVGELVSTTLVAQWLNECGLVTTWLDAREVIRTDHTYTDAHVDWGVTRQRIRERIEAEPNDIVLTQGFIGATEERISTTLGREGSDFTAAIFAACLDARRVTVWKDVAGIFNADPNQVADVVPMPVVSYREAVEMTYYGAKVIHPRTIRPLQNAGIELHVRSFKHDDAPGTVIGPDDPADGYPPVIVRKNGQRLIACWTRDLSFISEDRLTEIFTAFAHRSVRINMLRTRALKLSVVVDDVRIEKIEEVVSALSDRYEIKQYRDLDLYTVRHYGPTDRRPPEEGAEVLLEQCTTSTYQILMRAGGRDKP